jgi:ribonuclease P protein component
MRLWRIRDRATFQRLRTEGVRRRSGPITVTAVPLDDGQPPRVAFAIGRSVGHAVDRNRLRRRLRAVARDLDLPSGAYLVSARRDAVDCSTVQLADHVRAAALEQAAA